MDESEKKTVFSLKEWERSYYLLNNIQMWSSPINETFGLGKIWEYIDGSYISAKVTPRQETEGESPRIEQFWQFRIFVASTKTEIRTKSTGALEQILPMLIPLATGRINITKLTNTPPKP